MWDKYIRFSEIVKSYIDAEQEILNFFLQEQDFYYAFISSAPCKIFCQWDLKVYLYINEGTKKRFLANLSKKIENWKKKDNKTKMGSRTEVNKTWFHHLKCFEEIWLVRKL